MTCRGQMRKGLIRRGWWEPRLWTEVRLPPCRINNFWSCFIPASVRPVNETLSCHTVGDAAVCSVFSPSGQINFPWTSMMMLTCLCSSERHFTAEAESSLSEVHPITMQELCIQPCPLAPVKLSQYDACFAMSKHTFNDRDVRAASQQPSVHWTLIIYNTESNHPSWPHVALKTLLLKQKKSKHEEYHHIFMLNEALLILWPLTPLFVFRSFV